MAQIFPRWNPLTSWLVQIESLQDAASVCKPPSSLLNRAAPQESLVDSRNLSNEHPYRSLLANSGALELGALLALLAAIRPALARCSVFKSEMQAR